jgi:hypothetical protein
MKAILIIAAALAAGCSPQATAVNAPDAGCPDDCTDGCPDAGGDTDTDTDGDTDSDWECPDPIAETCPADVGEVLPPLLFTASELGAGTRIVDVAPWSVLAERDADGARTITVVVCPEGDGCSPTDARTASLELPDGSDLHAAGVTAAFYSPDDEASSSPSNTVALCGAAGCALYGAYLLGEAPSAELTPIPGGEVPGAAFVNGLWNGGGLTCAFGDGIRCFDGAAWSTPTAWWEPQLDYNDMETVYFDLLGDQAVAVGELGSFVISGFPGWSLWWDDAAPAWLTVQPAFFDDLGDLGTFGFAMAGEDGAYSVRPERWWPDCPIADEDIVLLIGGALLTPTLGVTASGRVFAADGTITPATPACYTGEVIGQGAHGVEFECAMVINRIVADEATVYGHLQCGLD